MAGLVPLTVWLFLGCGDRPASPSEGAGFHLADESRLGRGNASISQPSDLKIIRSGELRLEVRDVERSAHQADSIARQQSGFVAESQRAEGDDGKRTARLVIRVPTERFAAVLEQFRGLGSVKQETLSQEDVTRAYTDLETRLAVKEQTIARLRQLLATHAGKLSDVLEVEREISRVVTELEQLKGEKKYYDNRLALSTIGLTLFEPGALRSSPSLTVGEAFGQSLQVFSTSFAWLVYIVTFLAPWIAFATGLWFLGRYLRRRSRAA